MITREATLKDKAYWLAHFQSQVHQLLEHYRLEHQLTKTQLAAKLGVSKGYITQILNGEFDHKVSKLVELALAFDKVPFFEYVDQDTYLERMGDAFPDKNVVYPLHADKDIPLAADEGAPFNEHKKKKKKED